MTRIGVAANSVAIMVSGLMYAQPLLAQNAITGDASVKCGTFSSDPKSLGWETPAKFSINIDQITFERTNLNIEETQRWIGVRGKSGKILLVGSGSDKRSQWVMEFSGDWRGQSKTKLQGKFTNIAGTSGSRICEISM